MRPVIVTLLALSLAPPALAEEPKSQFEGLDDFATGLRQLLERFADDMQPMMEDLADRLQGLNGYHPPEVLPNGDIIIRKKTPEERKGDKEPDGDGIEL